MSSAMQLSFQKVQGLPKIWYSPYVENMRQLRDYPDYWRFIDTKSWTSGPDVLEGSFPLTEQLWRAEVDGNTVNIFRETNGTAGSVQTSFTHTEEVLSVSLEFDQLGRRMVAFEDDQGKVLLDWYDPVQAQQVMTEIEEGVTPHIASTRNYKRGSSTADSERILFYIKTSTKQVVYRKQTERFLMEHTLPSAPQDVQELLVVGKDLLGGLTVVGVYEDPTDGIKAYSWTAINDLSDVVIDDDRYMIEDPNFSVEEVRATISYVFSFVEIPEQEEPVLTFGVDSVTTTLTYADSQVDLDIGADDNFIDFSASVGGTTLLYQDATVELEEQTEPVIDFAVDAATITLTYQFALLELEAEEPNTTFAVPNVTITLEYTNV